MKRFITALVVVFAVFSTGTATGKEPGVHFEHLKPNAMMIGTWRYEGPLLEDVPGFAKKGTDYVSEVSWRWILNRNAVELRWANQFEGGKKVTGKGLVGWNAAEEKITYGGMDSLGSMSIGTITFDDDGKTSTLTSKGVDAEGETTEFKAYFKQVDKDTLTWKALHRSGDILEGESPVYEFKRVKRPGGKEAAK
jgi:hypothetical protein